MTQKEQQPRSQFSRRFLELIDMLLEQGMANSLNDIAGKLNTTSQTIRNIRIGRQDATVTMLEQLAKNFNGNVMWILTGKGEPILQSGSSTPSYTNEEKIRERILQAIDKIMNNHGINSFRAFCDLNGITYTTFADYKAGRIQKPNDQLLSVLNRYAVSPRYIFSNEGEMFLSGASEFQQQIKLMQELLEMKTKYIKALEARLGAELS